MCYRSIFYATTLGLLIVHLARPLQPVHAQPEHEAEAGRPFITNYRPSEYGAHNQIWAIAEDNRGVMYFGNVSGVLEYDGVSWRLIRLPTRGSLARDASGRIWVGGLDEFGYLAPDLLGQLSYDIVTQGHGGTLAVESESAQGATFIVTLPGGVT